MRLRITLAALIGMLIGVACSDDMVVMADTAANILAEAIFFDDTNAALDADTVQAAIDALDVRADTAAEAGGTRDGRLDALEARADPGPIQSALDTLSTTVTTQQAAVDDLETRLEAVEALEAPTAADVSFQNDDDPELDTVQAVIVSLQLRIAQLEAAQAEVGKCSPEFYEVATACVESSPRPSKTWNGAANECLAAELRLCTFEELKAGCFAGLKNDGAPELTGTWLDDQLVAAVEYTKDDGGCAGEYGTFSTKIGGLPFRCCRDR